LNMLIFLQSRYGGANRDRTGDLLHAIHYEADFAEFCS